MATTKNKQRKPAKRAPGKHANQGQSLRAMPQVPHADRLLNKAARSENLGDYDAAAELYQKVLRDQPNQLAALQRAGVLELKRENGDTSRGAGYLMRAAQLLPTSAPAQLRAGIGLYRSACWEEAERLFRQALKIQPNSAEGHNNLGVTLLRQDRREEAAEAFQAALTHAPDHKDARENLEKLNNHADAVDLRLQQAERLLEQEEFDSAAELFRQLSEEAPDVTDYKLAYADALYRGRRYKPAQAFLEAFLADNPSSESARYILANTYFEIGEYENAITELDQISEEGDLHKKTFHVRARIFVKTQCFAEADAQFELALAHEPKNANIHSDLGRMYGILNRSTAASLEYFKAININPYKWQYYNNLGNELKNQGRMLDAIDIYEEAIQRCPPNPLLLSNLLLCLNYVDGLSSAAIFDGHLRYGQAFSSLATTYRHQNDLTSDRRLRIGYISPDFRAHSVAFFFAPLLRCHDRAHFEIFLYADVATPDNITGVFRDQADCWRDIRNVSADQVAQMVHADGIDILIDLAGHTGGNRLSVLARKPAPVQVSWLGYPNTTGLKQVDYRIVDEISEPEGQSEAHSTEQIVRLPKGFHCMDAYDSSLPVGDTPSLENGYIRFGSFNYLGKLNERVVATWAEILKQVPSSQLLLKARGLGDKLTSEAYLSLFQRYGVSRDRILIAPYQPTQSDHLNLYRQIDIALDTFPYNGTTTTCEALWMGVPVVTFLGDRHASRVSASLLHQIGHPELVGADVEDYIHKAVALANDQMRIRELRKTLRQSFEASPLRDEAGFAQKFEAALKDMWFEYRDRARVAAPA